MLTPIRLLLAIVVCFLATAAASAHWRHKCRYNAVPMAPAMSYAPLMAYPAMPAFQPAAPALFGGGGGFSMQMQMAGDPSALAVGVGVLRALLGQFLGVPAPGTAGSMTRAELRGLLLDVLREVRGTPGKDKGMGETGEVIPPEPVRPSAEALRAREQLRRVAAVSTGTAEAQRAREHLQRVASAARQDAPRPADVQQARAELQRVAAEAARGRVAKTELASRGR